LVALLALALPFFFYVSNAKSPYEQNAADRVIVFISAPLQWATVATLDGASSVWRHYFDLVGVQADNDRWRQENADLKRELAARDEQRLENGRLRLLLGLREKAPDVRMSMARVVAVSPTPTFRSLRIDRGARDGVKVGAAVVNQDGVVGRVAVVTPGWADVMLLVDANSSTDVLVQRTRSRARVRGTGRDSHLGIQVEYLSRSADVEPGDVLVTSGTGTVFPKGLRVGTIVSVARGAFGLYQSAQIEPSVDFGRLEGVLVVVGGFSEDVTFEDTPDVSDAWGPLIDTTPETPSVGHAGGAGAGSGAGMGTGVGAGGTGR
jgi:rod shape-determining protein MreC